MRLTPHREYIDCEDVDINREYEKEMLDNLLWNILGDTAEKWFQVLFGKKSKKTQKP